MKKNDLSFKSSFLKDGFENIIVESYKEIFNKKF